MPAKKTRLSDRPLNSQVSPRPRRLRRIEMGPLARSYHSSWTRRSRRTRTWSRTSGCRDCSSRKEISWGVVAAVILLFREGLFFVAGGRMGGDVKLPAQTCADGWWEMGCWAREILTAQCTWSCREQYYLEQLVAQRKERCGWICLMIQAGASHRVSGVHVASSFLGSVQTLLRALQRELIWGGRFNVLNSFSFVVPREDRILL